MDLSTNSAINVTTNSATTNKVATVTLFFWIMKIAATTLGETAGDLLSMTMDVGYGLSSCILLAFFWRRW